jgi:Rieske Fe-S protein
MVPSWLALCWIAQGSGFESQRGHLFFGISPRGEISQEGFVRGWFSPCHKSIYRVSEDNFRGTACVSEWLLISVKRLGVGLS